MVTKGTSFKSVVSIFDRSGKELFKTYLASTIAVDTDISLNGKYLAIAEVNISGALVESGVKIIEIEKASTGDTTNSVVYKYNADANKIITDIKYQEKGQLVCIYNDSIHIIENGEDKTFLEFNKSTKFSDIDLKSHVVRAEEVSTGLFSSKTNITLTSISSKTDTNYEVQSVIKNLVSYEQITAVNLGTEVHFINLNGWLEKKYISAHEIKDVVIGTSIAGIIYRDRIKIITF